MKGRGANLESLCGFKKKINKFGNTVGREYIFWGFVVFPPHFFSCYLPWKCCQKSIDIRGDVACDE